MTDDERAQLFSPDNLRRYPFLAVWHVDERVQIPARIELIDKMLRRLAERRAQLVQRLADLELLPPPTHRALLDE